MSDFKIPDFTVGQEKEFAALDMIPWNMRMIGLDTILGLNLPFDKIKVGIIDSGYQPHFDLPEPVAVKSFGFGDTLDKNGHGNHVYGVVGKILTTSQYYISKELGADGSGMFGTIEKAIYWQIEQGVKIINMSLGSEKEYKPITRAIKYGHSKGVVFVVAAGNSGNKYLGYPAWLDEVIATGAVDSRKIPARFSNSGKTLDVVAPGVGINSTFLDNKYISMNGTSMAAPHVTGVCGVYMAYHLKNYGAFPTPDKVKEYVYTLSEDLDVVGWDSVTGNGIARIALGNKPADKENHPHKNFWDITVPLVKFVNNVIFFFRRRFG